MWKCSHNPFTGTKTAKKCHDKEVGKVGRSFDVSIDICEVAVLAIEMSKEEETWRRGTMGMTPHPTATNNMIDYLLNCPQFTTQRQDLLGQVSDVGYDVASMNSKDLCHLLLYGNPNESTFANRIILEATISFSKTTGRFN